MKNDTQTLQESIRAQAYLLSETAGHPPGMEEFFWLKAETMVLGRSATPAARSNAASKNSAGKTKAKTEPARASAKPSARKTGAGRLLAVK